MTPIAVKSPATGSSVLNNTSTKRGLIVSFAYQNWQGQPFCYLQADLKQAVATLNSPYDILYVNDLTNAGYTHGFAGQKNLDASCRHLSDKILSKNYSHVHLVGESMGSFGALLFASQLAIRKVPIEGVLAFSPLSFFCGVRAEQYGDKRFINSMNKVAQNTPSPLNDVAYMPPIRAKKVDLVFGTVSPVAHVETTAWDTVHAWRIKHYVPHAQIHAYPTVSVHASHELRQQNLLASVLQQHLTPYLPPSV